MCVRAENLLVAVVLALCTAYGNAGPPAKVEEPRAKFEPPDGRVLHGWGQHISLYEREAVPYIRATGRRCVIVSDYVDLLVLEKITPDTLAYVRQKHPKLAEGREDDEVRRILQSFLTTPARFADFRKRTRKPYIPLFGVCWHRSSDKRIAEVIGAAAFSGGITLVTTYAGASAAHREMRGVASDPDHGEPMCPRHRGQEPTRVT